MTDSKNIPNYVVGDQFPTQDANQIIKPNNIYHRIAENNVLSTSSIEMAINLTATGRQFAFNVSGSTNAVVLTTISGFQGTNGIPINKYAQSLSVSFKAIATNTGVMTINIDGTGSVAITKNGSALIGGEVVINEYTELVYNGTSFDIVNRSILPLSSVTKYSVNQAPLTAGTSNPAYLNGSGTNTLSFINISPTNSLIWTYGDGISRTITSNPASITGLANATYCLIFNESTLTWETPLLSNVLEVNFLPTVVVNGQYICVTNPLQTYFGSGGVWVKTNFVKFAEFTVAGGLIGTIISYELNGIKIIKQTVVINTLYTISVNIGSEYKISGYIRDDIQVGFTNETMSIYASVPDNVFWIGAVHSYTNKNICKIRTSVSGLQSPVASGVWYPRNSVTTGTLTLFIERAF